MTWRKLISMLVMLMAVAASAPAIDSGSDGSDGTFNPVKGATPWDEDGDGIVALRPEIFSIPGGRSFDARNGIFNFTEVNIPSDIQVVLRRDRLTSATYNPPIHILSQTTMNIDGEINADGSYQGGFDSGAGAPGGFDGSPNGAYAMGPSSSYYVGSSIVQPPIGGGGDQQGTGLYASGGGGAVVLAADQVITVSATGLVRAIGANNTVNFNAGGGPGSIRVVSSEVVMEGRLWTQSGQGGFSGQLTYGPIRVESYLLSGNGTFTGNVTFGEPDPVFFEANTGEPRLFIDRLIDNNAVVVDFPEWDPTNPDVYKPLVLPATLVEPFTVVVRAENIAEGRQVRVIAPQTTRNGTLALNVENGQIEAAVVFNGGSDFGTYENLNTIYADLVAE
ncbi:hypothetical protein KQI84_07740 [bacterium]|nr:hypothetical protein [bacterium]